jgi:hypothetical protein
MIAHAANLTADACAVVAMLDGLLNALSNDPLGKIIGFSALLVGCTTLGVLCWINFIRPKRQRRKLTAPGTAYFLVPDPRNHSCDYAIQTSAEEHFLKELTLPPDSELTVDFILNFSVPIAYSELDFECQGPTETKPYAIKLFNRFIEDGAGQVVTPGPDNKHYRDKHKVYHAREDRIFPPARIAIGFLIKTRASGRFPVSFGFIGNEVIGSIGGLFITVEQTPTVRMKCSNQAHREKECATVGVAPPKKN